jgi:hypothetical protein
MGAGNAVYLHPQSDNSIFTGGTGNASQLAPGTAVTGITMWGSASAVMGSDSTFDVGNGLFSALAIFDFDFSDPLLAGSSLAADTGVPVTWDFTIAASAPDGSPIAAISEYDMEAEVLFTQGWSDAFLGVPNTTTSSLHATGSMTATLTGGWTYSGRAVGQFYVLWTAPAGGTIDVSVSQITFGSVNGSPQSGVPEPGTFLLGLPLLALLFTRSKASSRLRATTGWNG